jgi:hypothetical protein
MAFVVKDRVQETTTTTGTGAVTLAGAAVGYQSFSAIGDGNSTYYCITAQTGTAWEVGIGTYTASTTSLSRDTVLSSSNAGSLVNFASGAKNVFVTYPSSNSVYASNTQVAGYTLSSNGPNTAPTWQLRGQVPVGGTIVRQDGLTSPIYVDADGTEWLYPATLGTLSPPSNYTSLPAPYAPVVTGINSPNLEPDANFLTASGGYLRIVYGNGYYVSIPSGQYFSVGATKYSTNGLGWLNGALGTTGFYARDIAFGNGIFVLVGNNQLNAASPSATYVTSTNATTWTIRSNAGWASTYIGGIAFGAGVFTTVLYGTTQGYSSTDGITWSSTTLPTASNWTRVRFINNRFVAIASGTTAIAYSTNGTSWTPATSASSNTWSDVAYFGGIYVMINTTTGTTYQTSTDLVTWTTRNFPISITASNIGTDNSRFYVLFETTYGLISTDGINWTFISAPSTHNDVAFVNNKLFSFAGLYDSSAVSSNTAAAILTTPTINYQSAVISMPLSSRYTGVAYGASTYVATSESGSNLSYSSNGSTWNATSSLTPSTVLFTFVAFGAGLFVAIGSNNTTQYFTSPDGINWTVRSYSLAIAPGGMVFAGGQFVIVGQNATVLTSPDGLSWTTRTGINKVWNRLAYGNGLYVAVESVTSTIMYSSDGITWTANAMNGFTSRGYKSIAFGGGVFVVLGSSASSNMVAVSTNATSWTEYPTLPAGTWQGVTFGNGIFWAVASATGAVSSDGISWKPASLMGGYNITFANDLFFGGNSSGASTAYIAYGTQKSYFRVIDGLKQYYGATTDGSSNSVVCSYSYLLTSSNSGSTFSINDNTVGCGGIRVAFGGGIFVAFSNAFPGVITSSDNGATWTFVSLYPAGTNPATNASGTFVKQIRYLNGYFVAVFNTASQGYAYSTNGTTWTYQVSGASTFTDMAYGNGQYVALNGANSVVLRSTNIAGPWATTATSPGSYNLIAFGNNIFAAVEITGVTVAKSTDNGDTWTTASLSSNSINPTSLSLFTFWGGYFCMGAGSSTNYWGFSSDGLNYTFRQMYNGTASNYNNVIGGSGNTGVAVVSANNYAATGLTVSTAYTGPFSYAYLPTPSSLTAPNRWYLRIR